MKTRKFKNFGLQRMYDLFRTDAEDNAYFRNTAAGNAYRNGYDGHPDRTVPSSLAHAAWAAGADKRHDEQQARERELYDEMDGSAAMDCPTEDLY
jgi:hypothetical protein